MTPQKQLATYLARFESRLRPVTQQERNDILREIEAHIRDSMEQSHEGLATTLRRLGDPEALARQYRDSALIQRATQSNSPIMLIKACLRLATKGVFGVFVLVCGVFGYAFGAGFVLVGLLKPFAPAHTGLWLQEGVIVSSGALISIPPLPAHEVLGWWIIPIALMLGSAILFVTTFTVRQSLKLSKTWQSRLGGRPVVSHA